MNLFQANNCFLMFTLECLLFKSIRNLFLINTEECEGITNPGRNLDNES